MRKPKKSWITECEFLNQHKKEFYLWQNQISKVNKKSGRRNHNNKEMNQFNEQQIALLRESLK